jgi:radical SAM superfamily enzyme YgiQ (UPF0313 family)
MRICFINPPFLGRFSRSQRSPGVIKSGTMYYPYWLAHAAALAEARGHDISLIDAPADGLSEDRLYDLVADFGPDLLVIESVTASWHSDCELAGRLKARHGQAALCMVGTHVTAMWRETLELEPAIDFVAIGEYDVTIAELADAIALHRDVAAVAGLAMRQAGQPVRSAHRPLLQNLDELPWIAPIYKRFLNIDHYYFNLSQHPMIMLIGGRGCNAMCFYCVYPQVIHGHRYRHRTPEHLIAEMLWVQENMPDVKEITFEDDNFGADRDFARRFAERAQERGVRLPFFANLRTTVDYETLASLRAAGLRNCAVGFESGDDRILRNMRKGQNTSMQARFVRDAHKVGLLVHGCFMVGFPGETRETMEKTLRLAFAVKPDSAQFYPVMPYPGTGAYAYYRQSGFLATTQFREWLTDDGGHRCVLNLPNLTPQEIEAFCERAFKRFHFRPRYIVYKLWQAVRHPREGWRSFVAGLHFIWYLLTNKRRRQPPFVVQPAARPENWLADIRVPLGRMESIKRRLEE